MNEYVGCCCAQDLQASVQAVVDQMVGVITLAESRMIEPTAEQLLKGNAKLAELLQFQLDQYTSQHGAIDLRHTLDAAEWLLTEMRG